MTEKSVLDIGAASGHQRSDWMHGFIDSVASFTVGIDLDANAVDSIHARGDKSFLHADAGSIDLEDTFDVVHAGELIEHLDDFQSFLAAARRHMKPDGVLILTTPNVFCISNFVYRFGSAPRVNSEHTCWFCEDTLGQLLQREGFEVLVIDYVAHETPNPARALLSRGVRAVLPRRLKWNTLLMVAGLPSASAAL